MRISLTVTDNFTAKLQRRIRTFERQVDAARSRSAKIATDETRKRVKNTRPFAPPRPGRNHEQISKVARWSAIGTGPTAAGVALRMNELDSRASHWIIQEIGTGQRATIHAGGRPNPVGRPEKDATYVKTVKSQKGRRISSGLVFATGPGGQWVRPGAASGQQLFLRRQIKGVPATPTKSQAGIRITREIPGQHFVRDGGTEGFREYRRSVLAAARTQFRKGQG